MYIIYRKRGVWYRAMETGRRAWYAGTLFTKQAYRAMGDQVVSRSTAWDVLGYGKRRCTTMQSESFHGIEWLECLVDARLTPLLWKSCWLDGKTCCMGYRDVNQNFMFASALRLVVFIRPPHSPSPSSPALPPISSPLLSCSYSRLRHQPRCFPLALALVLVLAPERSASQPSAA